MSPSYVTDTTLVSPAEGLVSISSKGRIVTITFFLATAIVTLGYGILCYFLSFTYYSRWNDIWTTLKSYTTLCHIEHLKGLLQRRLVRHVAGNFAKTSNNVQSSMRISESMAMDVRDEVRLRVRSRLDAKDFWKKYLRIELLVKKAS